MPAERSRTKPRAAASATHTNVSDAIRPLGVVLWASVLWWGVKAVVGGVGGEMLCGVWGMQRFNGVGSLQGVVSGGGGGGVGSVACVWWCRWCM